MKLDPSRAEALGSLLWEVMEREEVDELVTAKEDGQIFVWVIGGNAIIGYCQRPDLVEAVRGVAYALRGEDEPTPGEPVKCDKCDGKGGWTGFTPNNNHGGAFICPDCDGSGKVKP